MSDYLAKLSVALGLDAGEYTRGLTKAEAEAREFGREIGEQIRSGVFIATGALTGLALAAERSFAIIRNQAGAIDAFNDLRDATGSSIENISALDQIARQTGGTFATAESVLLKFNTALKAAKPNSEAEAAIKAIGLSVRDLKTLDPAEALRQTAVAFGQFETDANKARAMQILFGKSVKEVAPFLGDLAEKTQLVGITSAATATQAETFNKQIDALKASAEDAGRSIVSNLLPPLNQFLANAKQIQQMGGFGVIVKDAARAMLPWTDPSMTGDNGGDIRRAMKERERLQKDLAWQQSKGRPTRAVEDSLAENARLLAVLRVKQKNEVDMLNLGQNYGDAVSRRFEDAAKLPEILKPPKAGKGSKGDAAAAARELLGFDLDAIRIAADEQAGAVRNAEKLLNAQRSAGLTDDAEYYAERVRLTERYTATQESAARDAIARMQKESLAGKELIANNRKIEQEEARLAQVQKDGAAAVQVLGIEQAAAFKRTESSILAARNAAEDFFQTTNAGYSREISGIGQGDKFRQFMAGLQGVDASFEQRRRDLANRRSQAQLLSPNGLSESQAEAFDKELAIINEYQKKGVASFQTYYAAVAAAQMDWLVGASDGIRNYFDETQNLAKQSQELFGNAFKGLEDALTNFVTKGKLDFKSLADSIINDLVRIAVRQSITGPLANALSGLFSFGAGGMTAPGTSDLTSFTGRASGGFVSSGGLYRVNENGPELLDYQGKQYLMTGAAGGKVTANHKTGGSVIQNFTVGDVATVSMVRKAVQASQAQGAAALQRRERYGGAGA